SRQITRRIEPIESHCSISSRDVFSVTSSGERSKALATHLRIRSFIKRFPKANVIRRLKRRPGELAQYEGLDRTSSVDADEPMPRIKVATGFVLSRRHELAMQFVITAPRGQHREIRQHGAFHSAADYAAAHQEAVDHRLVTEPQQCSDDYAMVAESV